MSGGVLRRQRPQSPIKQSDGTLARNLCNCTLHPKRVVVGFFEKSLKKTRKTVLYSFIDKKRNANKCTWHNKSSIIRAFSKGPSQQNTVL